MKVGNEALTGGDKRILSCVEFDIKGCLGARDNF